MGDELVSAVQLRATLLELADSLGPTSRPEVVRAWTDPVLVHGPEPVGHRQLAVVAVCTADGWATAATGPARSTRGGCEVEVRRGVGCELVTLTGWTPAEFADPRYGQPEVTRSTAPGLLCDYCHGWGVCLECEGTGRSRTKRTGYGRCSCFGSNHGVGRCLECAGRGHYSPRARSAGEPPVEAGHATLVAALRDIAHRTCACGEFRCHWRTTASPAEGGRVARFEGPCQGCGAGRCYAFSLPNRAA
ncbi:hypothetical protein ABH931_004534 [Streptacidiphilus sp. MAP12-33]|uniref:hypothetical protein n=1 Tax=Streptacidiphilus sp. MAP12-33 TaxID=3156266 RepID=UPI0035179EC8